AAFGVEEDVLVGEGAGAQRLRVPDEQAEVRHGAAEVVHQRLVLLGGEVLARDRLDPGHPAQALLGEGLGAGHRASSVVGAGCAAGAGFSASTRSPWATRSWKVRKETSWERVTMPSASQPAASRARRCWGAASR